MTVWSFLVKIKASGHGEERRVNEPRWADSTLSLAPVSLPLALVALVTPHCSHRGPLQERKKEITLVPDSLGKVHIWGALRKER